MSSLSTLRGWETTAHSLHKVTQLLGALRLLSVPHNAYYLENSTNIRPKGLSTGLLPFGEVILNFPKARIVYTPTVGQPLKIEVAGESQATLFEKLLTAIEKTGFKLGAKQGKRRTATDAFFSAMQITGLPYKLERKDFTDPEVLVVNKDAGTDYARILNTIYTATARFRAGLVGTLTPVVVWPEHFDLSFLWFPGVMTDNLAPQMNFGFAPYTDGSIPRPYLYAYAYPMPDGFERLELPVGASWNTEGWSGMIFPYDKLVKAGHIEERVEAAFERVFELLAPSLSGALLLPK